MKQIAGSKGVSLPPLALALAVVLTVALFQAPLPSMLDLSTLASLSKAQAYSTLGDYLSNSVLELRNLSAAWTTRFWVMEERQYVPLLFDTSLFSSDFNVKEFSNLAIAAIPSLHNPLEYRNDSAFIVAVRSNIRAEGPWGSVCGIGAVKSHLLVSLAVQQPLIDRQFPEEPVEFIDSRHSTVQDHSEAQLEALPSTWDAYHSLLEVVRLSKQLYSRYDHSDLWARPLRNLSPRKLRYGDVRILYRIIESSMRQVCFMSQISGWRRSVWKGIALGMYVVCYDERELLETDVEPSIVLLARIPDQYDHRNLVPLIEKSGVQYQNELLNLTWFMDAMGGEHKRPLLFPISLTSAGGLHIKKGLVSVPYGGARADLQFTLENCENLTEWRGNSPVVHFTNRLWITIVHKVEQAEKNSLNELGRTYKNKIVIFESDVSAGLPKRCLRIGPEATDSDIFQRRPHLQFEWPFAFVLGLVHLGRVENYIEGEAHQFLLSAGLGDYKPAFKVVEIFVPRKVLL